MTVRELIETLQNLPEDWKDDQVICFHGMQEFDNFPEGYSQEDEEIDNDLNESDMFDEPQYVQKPMLVPVENILRITIIKANKERSLFQMPIYSILLQ